MLNFKPLKGQVEIIKEYINSSDIEFCDISIGAKYMWRDVYFIDYAFCGETLILKESCESYQNAFYFPFGKEIDKALCEIEEYCIANSIPLLFCCIDNEKAKFLKNRYFNAEVESSLDWNDYIYNAQEFKNFKGKKYNGQRNHINKFKKLYPDYKFKVIEQQDLPRIFEFLQEFEKQNLNLDSSAQEEESKVADYINNMFNLSQFGGLIELNEKVIAISIGEKINETLIVHIEKALKTYSGIYPTMANAFANEFAKDGVKFINREEDCGDMGLRTSKQQYKPILIKEKNSVLVKTLFDRLLENPFIETERLVLTKIKEQDKKAYAKLFLDDQNNKYYGYDYREDLKDNVANEEYFYNFQQQLKDKKEEFSFAVCIKGENGYLCGQMIGEIVLHNFDFFGGIEQGFRFLPEYQHKGYALESVVAMKEFLYNNIGAKVVKTRCMKQNIPSYNLIKRSGGEIVKETDSHYYFHLKRENN